MIFEILEAIPVFLPGLVHSNHGLDLKTQTYREFRQCC